MAADLYAIAVELRPGDLDAHAQLAECLARSDRPLAAARRLVELARIHTSRGSLHLALATCRRLLQLCPERFSVDSLSDIVLNIGRRAAPLCREAARKHRGAGRDDHAADLLRLCGRLCPGDVGPWRELALLYLDHQMWPEAAWALRRAAPMLRELGPADSYVQCLRSILRLEPSDQETRRELPRALIGMDRPELALVELGALLRMSPGDAWARETMAQAYAMLGRLEACLALLGQRVESLYQHGRRAQARDLLARARGWRPEDVAFARALRSLRRRPLWKAADRRPESPPAPGAPTEVLDLASLSSSSPSPSTSDEVVDATNFVELVDETNPRASRVLAPPPLPRAPARASMVQR